MKKKIALIIAGIIFSLVALGHLLRVIFAASIVVEGYFLPMWISYLGFVITMILAIWMFVVSKNRSAKSSSQPNSRTDKPKLVGINHIALEVGNIEQALKFYQAIFDFTLRGKSEHMAFIDLGDQFIALMESSDSHQDTKRHFGLVVPDRSHVRKLAEAAEAKFLEGKFMDFLDPWGNHVQIVEYRDIQFIKAPEVLKAMGLQLQKSDKALEELAKKGINVA